jgi:antitoxin component YwqK of YwqJK toxin-antitoxin module
MINNSIILFFLIFTFLSCEYKRETKVYFEGKEKVKGEFINGKRDGLFIYYYPNGRVRKIENYKLGRYHGVRKIYFPNGKLEVIEEYQYKNNNIPITQLGFTESGDTNLIFKDKTLRMYYDNKRPYSFIPPNNKAFIEFNEQGKIVKYKGPLYFMTKKDSADFEKYYPDWKEQIAIFVK